MTVVAEYLQCQECKYVFRVDRLLMDKGLTHIYQWQCPCGAKHTPDMDIEANLPKPEKKPWPGEGDFQEFWKNQLGIFGIQPLLSAKPMNWWE